MDSLKRNSRKRSLHVQEDKKCSIIAVKKLAGSVPVSEKLGDKSEIVFRGKESERETQTLAQDGEFGRRGSLSGPSAPSFKATLLPSHLKASSPSKAISSSPSESPSALGNRSTRASPASFPLSSGPSFSPLSSSSSDSSHFREYSADVTGNEYDGSGLMRSTFEECESLFRPSCTTQNTARNSLIQHCKPSDCHEVEETTEEVWCKEDFGVGKESLIDVGSNGGVGIVDGHGFYVGGSGSFVSHFDGEEDDEMDFEKVMSLKLSTGSTILPLVKRIIASRLRRTLTAQSWLSNSLASSHMALSSEGSWDNDATEDDRALHERDELVAKFCGTNFSSSRLADQGALSRARTPVKPSLTVSTSLQSPESQSQIPRSSETPLQKKSMGDEVSSVTGPSPLSSLRSSHIPRSTSIRGSFEYAVHKGKDLCSPEAATRALTSRLKSALKNKESFTILISGPPGIGKTTIVEYSIASANRQEQKEAQKVGIEVLSANHSPLPMLVRRGSAGPSTPVKNLTADDSNVITGDSEDIRCLAIFSPVSSSRSAMSSSPAMTAAAASTRPNPTSPLPRKQCDMKLPRLIAIRVYAPIYRDDASVAIDLIAQLSCALQCQTPFPVRAELSYYFSVLHDLLKTCRSVNRAVVIVLDRFECFTIPHRQTLMYNLCDLQHSAGIQLCIICVSSVLNVAAFLEKRVRSRFSLERINVNGSLSYRAITNTILRLLLLSDPSEVEKLAKLEEKIEKRRTEKRVTSTGVEIGDEKTDGEVLAERVGLNGTGQHDLYLIRKFLLAYNRQLVRDLTSAEMQAQWKHETENGQQGRWFVQRAAEMVLGLPLPTSRSSIVTNQNTFDHHSRNADIRVARVQNSISPYYETTSTDFDEFFYVENGGRRKRLRSETPLTRTPLQPKRRKSSATFTPQRETFRDPLSPTLSFSSSANADASLNSINCEYSSEWTGCRPKEVTDHSDEFDIDSDALFGARFLCRSPLQSVSSPIPSPCASMRSTSKISPLSFSQSFTFKYQPDIQKAYVSVMCAELSITEHYVLGAFVRLHRKKMLPKTFARVLTEVHNFKTSASHKQHAAIMGYRRAFIRLIDLGVVELASYTQAEIGNMGAVPDLLGTHVPCCFPQYRAYLDNVEKYCLPTDLERWIRTL